jgi:CheY-like chemotaxis protein
MTDTTHNPRSVTVVAADLLFSSRIRAAAEQLGVQIQFARSDEQLYASAVVADLVILDLDARWLDAPAAIRHLAQAASKVPIVAFVSHVRADAIQAARDAGADRVLARSAFVRMLPDILAGR